MSGLAITLLVISLICLFLCISMAYKVFGRGGNGNGKTKMDSTHSVITEKIDDIKSAVKEDHEKHDDKLNDILHGQLKIAGAIKETDTRLQSHHDLIVEKLK